MTSPHFTLWMLVTSHLALASRNVSFLKRGSGESVGLLCELEESSEVPIGLYVKRKSLQPEEEVIFHMGNEETQNKPSMQGRVHIQGSLDQHQLTVTFSLLEPEDSGLYTCTFVYDNISGFRSVQGRVDYFLWVEATESASASQCSCPTYSTLLYAIAAVTGLFLLLIIGLARALWSKSHKQRKPQNPQPIYEDMSALKEKHTQAHLPDPKSEDTDAYVKPATKQAQENHYVSPKWTSGNLVLPDTQT